MGRKIYLWIVMALMCGMGVCFVNVMSLLGQCLLVIQCLSQCLDFIQIELLLFFRVRGDAEIVFATTLGDVLNDFDAIGP